MQKLKVVCIEPKKIIANLLKCLFVVIMMSKKLCLFVLVVETLFLNHLKNQCKFINIEFVNHSLFVTDQ
jgi:hypothetical protein